MVFNGCMLRLQRLRHLEGWAMRRRLMRALESDRAFAIAVICLGLFPVAVVVAVLFLK